MWCWVSGEVSLRGSSDNLTPPSSSRHSLTLGGSLSTLGGENNTFLSECVDSVAHTARRPLVFPRCGTAAGTSGRVCSPATVAVTV